MPTSRKLTRLPTIVIVGRPNVGKSTLFNRLVGSRRAIVGNEPGITRDRLYGEAHWRGHDLRLVDTGGIVPGETEVIPAEIFRQTRVALEEAEAVILVIDGRSELAAPDLELARLLRKSGKPLFLAVNKADSSKQDGLLDDFHRLGVAAMFPVSAEHGRGVDELLDSILEVLRTNQVLPAVQRDSTAKQQEISAAAEGSSNGEGRETTDHEELRAETRVAIIGHPNVGKSTLLNRLTGAERSIVSPIPGTTRDAVDALVEQDGKLFRFVDTAGIRRRGKTHLMAEKLSVVMARKHLESADIALLVIDATEGVTALDAVIAGYAHESGRSLIILVNKWDQIASGEKRAISQARAARIEEHQRPSDRASYEQRLRFALKFLNYAPVLFISAATGRGTEKIFPTLEQVAAERRKRISTGEMNRFLKQIDFSRAPVPVRQQVKILYLTQVATAPPTFVLFTDRKVKLHFSYQRFLENQIRRAFGFLGTPIWIKVRARA
jgi:GTP-binding protein